MPWLLPKNTHFSHAIKNDGTPLSRRGYVDDRPFRCWPRESALLIAEGIWVEFFWVRRITDRLSSITHLRG